MHRLDKDTSGLLVFAKSEKAQRILSGQFKSRTTKRRYLAISMGVPGQIGQGFGGLPNVTIEEGGVIRIESEIGRHPANRIKMAVVRSGGRRAVTRIRLIRQLACGSASLVECRLETGRTHQIRVHLDRIGHPLIGDPLYGAGAQLLPQSVPPNVREFADKFSRQALHAAQLGFMHPESGEMLSFDSPLPDDMAQLLAALEND